MTKQARLAVIAGVLLMAGAWIQAQVTASDLTRLETTAGQIEASANTLKRADPTLATEVLKTLADVRDEITYLKVKLRREGSVPRTEFVEVRDRLETLRIRAGAERVTAQPVLMPDPDGPTVGRAASVAVGTEFDVRLLTPLNSATAKVEQRFEVVTLFDIKVGNVLAVPAGTLVRGFVSSVRPAGRLERRGSITLSFDEIVLGTRNARIRASVLQALDPKITEDIGRIGTGAVVGAVIGVGKGALIGVLVGAGGTIASTEGSDVDLPNGTVLRLRLDQPLDVPGTR